ncbi:MAG: hypothetical protein Q7S52_05865 [bacterium]|nr:hypothetical protein [bacterium]
MTKEAATQREKVNERWVFDHALQFVCERYPELKERVVRSLETPQLNDHHTEGPTMESHLRLIVETLNDMADGRFHDILADEPEAMEFLRRSVTVQDSVDPEKEMLNPDMLTYAFTHDIAKPDTLLVKLESEKGGVEMTLEDWQAAVEHGEYDMVGGKRVVSISYYHPSKKSAGQHGNMGAEILANSTAPKHLLAAIRKHEVAYQFSKINALTYEEHFAKSDLSPEEQELAIAASYADTMASLTAEGKPDLKNFLFLIQSRKNYLLVRSCIEAGMQFRENDLRALMKQDKVLTQEDVEHTHLHR